MLPGAMYENRESFLTIDIVLMANRNLEIRQWRHDWWRAAFYPLMFFFCIRGNRHERVRENSDENCPVQDVSNRESLKKCGIN